MDAAVRAHQLLAVGRWREVVDVLADERAAGTGWALDLTARALLLGGDVRGAVDTSARAVAAGPDSASAHDVHARALLADDRPRRAAASALRAVELAPDDWGPSVLAAHVLVAGDQAGTAAWYARRAVALAPNEPATHVAIADSFWTTDARISRQALLEALRLDPQHVEAQRLLGHLEVGTDRLEAGAGELAHTAARSAGLSSADFARVGGAWLHRLTALTFLAAVVAVCVVYSVPAFGPRPMWGLVALPLLVAAFAAVSARRLDRRLRGALGATLRTTLRSPVVRLETGVVGLLLLATAVAALAPDDDVRRVAATTALVTMVVAGLGGRLASWAVAGWRAARRAVRDR